MNKFISAMELKNSLRVKVANIKESEETISNEDKIISIIEKDILESTYNCGEIGFECIDGNLYISRAQVGSYYGPSTGTKINLEYVINYCQKNDGIRFNLIDRPVGDINNRAVLYYSFDLPQEIKNPGYKKLAKINNEKGTSK